MKREFKENESIDYCVLDYDCPYLEGKKTRMYYRFIPKATKDLCSALVKRGWRRFGYSYFHPICKDCNECKSLRIDVKNFTLSKSQKKAIKRNSQTKILIRKPTVTFDHIDLYNRYHKYKSKKSGWKFYPIDINSYYEEFVAGAHDYGKEVLYFIDDKLVGVDLIDIVDDGISSIYFFYDPEYERFSLGIFSLLKQIEFAQKLNLEWIYLGYWVQGCASFAYKRGFKPHQLLDGCYNICEDPKWYDAD